MTGPSDFGRRALAAGRSAGRIGATMVRSGLLHPGPPIRTARQLNALRRWGTLMGGTVVSTAARDPDRTAVVDDEGELTYAELDERTDRLAVALGGLGSPSRIAVLCRNHRGMVQSLVACSKLGADLVMLNTGMSTAQLLDVVRGQDIEVVIADPEFGEFLDALPEGVRTVTALGPDSDMERLIDTTSGAGVRPPERAGRTIVLSSGTTGTPKGARRHSRPGMKPLFSILSRIPFRVCERTVIEAPLFHTWGYAMLQAAIPMRSTVILRRRFDPEQTLRTVAESKATVLIAVPVMLQRILELPEEVRRRYDTSTLRITASSGSALPGALATAYMDAFGDHLYNLYGSTEASWVSIATPADLRACPDTAGTPPPGTRLAILDEQGRPLPPGTPGRIFVANELMFEGYTGGQSKEMRDGLMSLGDVGEVDEQGRLFVRGRDDDMIVSGGENVFPSAVEEVLAVLPEVREVAVVGAPDPEFGQRLVAYVVRHPGADLDADAVRAHVRSKLARFSVPRDVHFVDELPRNATGKIVRARLAPAAQEDPA